MEDSRLRHKGDLNGVPLLQGGWAQGYRAALRDHGLPFDETLIFAYASTCGVAPDEPYVAFLSRGDRPSAVFAVTDYNQDRDIDARARSDFGHETPTAGAVLRRVPWIYQHHQTASTCSLAHQVLCEVAPSGVQNAFRQMWIAHHVRDA